MAKQAKDVVMTDMLRVYSLTAASATGLAACRLALVSV